MKCQQIDQRTMSVESAKAIGGTGGIRDATTTSVRTIHSLLYKIVDMIMVNPKGHVLGVVMRGGMDDFEMRAECTQMV